MQGKEGAVHPDADQPRDWQSGPSRIASRNDLGVPHCTGKTQKG
jgi:hypothetical protein